VGRRPLAGTRRSLGWAFAAGRLDRSLLEVEEDFARARAIRIRTPVRECPPFASELTKPGRTAIGHLRRDGKARGLCHRTRQPAAVTQFPPPYIGMIGARPHAGHRVRQPPDEAGIPESFKLGGARGMRRSGHRDRLRRPPEEIAIKAFWRRIKAARATSVGRGSRG